MVLKLKGFVRTKNERREKTLSISEIMKPVSCFLDRLQNSVLAVSSSNRGRIGVLADSLSVLRE